MNGDGPVDPYGWGGSGADPYPKDLGDLWLGGAPRFPSVTWPSVNLTATASVDDPSTIHVVWTSPATAKFTVYYVTQDGVRHSWHASSGQSSATFKGKAGQSYWFWATATSWLGWTGGGGSDVVTVPHLNHGEVTS
jgi:hypothetical protein